MDFEMYMEREIPGYKSLIPEEVLADLKHEFEEKENYRKARESAVDMALNHNQSGIDYSTTIEKNMANENRHAANLESKLEAIKKELGINKEETTSNIHR